MGNTLTWLKPTYTQVKQFIQLYRAIVKWWSKGGQWLNIPFYISALYSITIPVLIFFVWLSNYVPFWRSTGNNESNNQFNSWDNRHSTNQWGNMWSIGRLLDGFSVDLTGSLKETSSPNRWRWRWTKKRDEFNHFL